LSYVKLNKVTFLTGASSGIGKALAYILAKNGHDLILIARNADKLAELADDIRSQFGVQVATFANDISKMSELQFVISSVKSEGVFVEYVINNAGLGDFGFFAESDWHKNEQQINLNMKSLTYICHAFLPHMKMEKKGHIVNIASTAAFRPGPLMAVYFASKAYVLHFSEALADELKQYNVYVSAVCPGPTETNFAQAANAAESDLFRNKKIPSAEEIAEYTFLAMMKRKTVAVPGFKNNALIFIQRFAPRKLTTILTRLIIGKD
jgi:uncharacterized protein